jgi:uroporphyrin-III C-methyltransferase/precorrin-2 dehydrogenase/sirohydrochlorin ferrochelatase
MKYFPIFIHLEQHRVVIAGDTNAVVAKARLLSKSAAQLHIYTSKIDAALETLVAKNDIHLYRELPRRVDLESATLVYLDYNDVAIARGLRASCRELGVLCNTIDNAGASDFISAAIVDRDPVVVAIGSEGSSPVLVRRIKNDIEHLLSSGTGAIARLAARLRPAVRSTLSPTDRLRFWQQFFSGAAETTISSFGIDAARTWFQTRLRTHKAPSERVGHVALVGAGPGDPDLLTLKASRLLGQADVVLYDRLVDRRILDLARRDAKLLEVGKIAGGKSWQQEDINRELLSHVAAGSAVVRLKSGDPMIYGRADEELDVLESHGINYDVIPGITAAAAAAASMRTSLTRRSRNSAFTLLTAQDVAGFAEHDWRHLARAGATSAIYMGVRAAPFVQRRLLMHGAAAATPITIVEKASRDDERIVNGELQNLENLLAAHHINGPAIIFVGLSARTSSRSLLETLPVEAGLAAA